MNVDMYIFSCGEFSLLFNLKNINKRNIFMPSKSLMWEAKKFMLRCLLKKYIHPLRLF